jgi:uncharacterized protein (UPF0297 family)
LQPSKTSTGIALFYTIKKTRSSSIRVFINPVTFIVQTLQLAVILLSNNALDQEFVKKDDAEQVKRYVNGVKNKLDSQSFNAISSGNLFLISTDPSTVQVEIMLRNMKL